MGEPHDNVVVKQIATNKLDQTEFWNLNRFKDNGEDLQMIHRLVVERLQQESPDADMLELMLMERACFLYIFMRAKELDAEEFRFDRTYAEMLRMWVSMAADLRKQRLRAEEMASIRAAVVGEIARALKEALAGVDPLIANNVTAKLVHLVAV